LYPVASMFFSLTSTAPTCLRIQVDRVEASRAILRKYLSQSGLIGLFASANVSDAPLLHPRFRGSLPFSGEVTAFE
jgi:hypothetical protein